MLPHLDGDSDDGVPPLTGGARDAEPEDNDKDLDLEDDNNEDDEDDELKWNSGMSKCKDLFSDAEFDSAQECLDQCQAQHNFDIKVNSGHAISTTRNHILTYRICCTGVEETSRNGLLLVHSPRQLYTQPKSKS